MKNLKKAEKLLIIVVALVVAIMDIGVVKVLDVRADEKEIVRVGFIEQEGFNEETDPHFFGYAVEYLDKIAEYTGWEYEYVYDTLENCISRTESGDIDLLCMMQYTESRAKKFLYSSVEFGYEYTIVYTTEDADIYYQDYEALAGKRIGLMSGSVHSEAFVAMMDTMGLSVDECYYTTEQKALKAMEEGEVVAVAVGSLHKHDNVKVVDRFGTKPVYCVTGKENEELMEELSTVLQRLKILEPEIEAELIDKYYGVDAISSSPMFTREEAEYIANAEPIRVKLMQEARPLSYVNSEEAGGLFVSYLNMLAEKSGLEFEIEIDATTMTMEEQTRQVLEEDYLMLRPKSALVENGLDEELIMTTPLLETTLAYVKHEDRVLEPDRDDYVFAITNELKYLEELLVRDVPECQVLYFGSADECLEAVINGTADMAIQDSYVVTYLLQKPRYADNLVEFPGVTYTNGMCLIGNEEKQLLFNILDKTIAYISEKEKEDLVSMELILHPYEQDFIDFLYRYGNWIVVIVVCIILSALIYTVLLHRITSLQYKRKEYEMLRKKIQQDELTGVYNRSYFYEEARRRIDNTEEEMCIVLMDITNFKVINDLYGMETGDRLLKFMADELTELGSGRNFIVSRFNGDHFYMCLTKKDFEEIDFKKRYKTFLEEMDVTVIYGVFNVDEQRDLPVNIMCDRANLATHDRERKRSEFIRFYSEDERKRIVHEREIENDMEKALEEQQFCVYIQPKYNVSNEKIIGGEALVRWKHPQKGMIPPGMFISIFEKNGFIMRLDYFVWEETCKCVSELKKKGYENLPISVNVSRAHFYGKELKDKLQELIQKYELLPEDIELEITETICAEDPDIVYKRIKELRALGFKIAMDDFGSGYSSLNMLKEVPLDIIKMDLKFLDGGEDVEKGRYILHTLINLAQNMQLKVVMEGVETKEQVEFLRDIGSYYVQGYYYSRPVDIATYEAMLEKERKGE